MTTAQMQQCKDALALANDVRTRNAQVKRDIAALSHADGCERVALLLGNPAGPISSMPIGKLLTCIRKVGEDGMIRYLRHAGIFSTTKRVGQLTLRQRRALTEVLQDRTLLWPATGMAA